MPTLKLTKSKVERIDAPDPSGKQMLHWDSELPGLGVLASGKTKAKTYVVQKRLPNGVVRRLTIGSTKTFTLDQARDDAREKLVEMSRGKDPKLERRKEQARAKTLRSVLDDYLSNTKLRDKSRRDYRASVERYLGSWLSLPILEITPAMVRERHRAIAREVAGEGRYSGEAAANMAMRTLRLLWNAAAEDADDDETLPANPVRLKKRWFDVERRERMVRSDQLPAFYKAVNKLPSRTARDYLLLLLFTGLRRREASTLRWDDVDSPTAIIRLPASTTKAGRKLDLPMSSFVRELLDVRCANATEAANKFVFPADSRSRHIEEPKFPLGLVAKATGIAVSVHDLRRTYITVAESADISPIALKGLVNHSLGNDVTSGYIQMPIERLREAAEKVCERMKQLCEVEKLEGAIPMSLVSG